MEKEDGMKYVGHTDNIRDQPSSFFLVERSQQTQNSQNTLPNEATSIKRTKFDSLSLERSLAAEACSCRIPEHEKDSSNKEHATVSIHSLENLQESMSTDDISEIMLSNRFHELKLSKFEIDKQVISFKNFMTNFLLKQVTDFKHTVQCSSTPFCQQLLNNCVLFERELQSAAHKGLFDEVKAIEHIKIEKMKCKDHLTAGVRTSEETMTLQREVKTSEESFILQSEVATSRQPLILQSEVATSRQPLILQKEVATSRQPLILQSEVMTSEQPLILQSEVMTSEQPLILQSEVMETEEDKPKSTQTSKQVTEERRSNVNSVDLLLIGNSGNGKSATGNSILNRTAFRRSAFSHVMSACSIENIKTECTQIEDKFINVIDGPSINYSGTIQKEELGGIMNAFYHSLELCNFEFTALLIVLKFGDRFTNQEVETMKLIRSVLGNNVISDYGVCVITYGDIFADASEENEQMTFDSWVENQTGNVKNLFEECNNRCVLFDNATKCEEIKKAQVNKLISILPQGKRYSRKEFDQASGSRSELLSRPDLSQLLTHMAMEIEEINEKIRNVDAGKEENTDRYILTMSRLLKEVVQHSDALNTIGLVSPDVETLKLQVTFLENSIKLKIQQRTKSEEIMSIKGGKAKNV